MAENQAAVADAATAGSEAEFIYNVQVQDSGPATKRVVVDIPRQRIAEKLEEQFSELRQQAHIPGFRPGRAPRKLVERKFESDVKEQVRRALVSESYQQAVEKNNLQVIGEPHFDKPDDLNLPDDGDFSYSFEVEVTPHFALPDFSGLTVKKPKVGITEENVDQAMTNLREQQGTLVPVEDRGVQSKDFLTADVHVKLDGQVVGHHHDTQLVARPGRVAGVQVADLDKQLEGLKPEETRTISIQAPESHPDEKIRGKQIEIELKLKDIKRLQPVDITPEFLGDLGFANEAELRDALREQLNERIAADTQAAMRSQVETFLLTHVPMELPAKLSDRQELRVVNRRAVDLMMRGVPKEQIEANLDQLKAGAKEEAARELKLFFILQQIANDHQVDVDEGEINGRIAMIAIQQGRRPEKVKQEMSSDGRLADLYVRLREQKAVDKILAQVKIEDVDITQPPEEEKKAE